MNYLVSVRTESIESDGNTTTVVVFVEDFSVAKAQRAAEAFAAVSRVRPIEGPPIKLFREYHPYRPPPISRTFVVPSEKLDYCTVAHKLRRWQARAPPAFLLMQGFRPARGTAVALLRAGQVL